MKRIFFNNALYVILILFLLGGIGTLSVAELRSLKIEISDYVSLADAIKIRRLLEPWAEAKNITFHSPVDKNGKERLFSTVVEIIPRRGISKYSETHAFDVYDIMHQLKDSRYRGRHGLGQVRLLKTEATVRGTMFAYPAFTRSSIRDIPGWARWRPHISEIHHAIRTSEDDQKFVFSASPEYDQLRNDVAQNNRPVEVQGKVVGFDGACPILKIQTYKLGVPTNRRNTTQPAQEKGNNPVDEKKPKYDYIEDDR